MAWWERPGLEAVDGRLHVAGRDAEALAREHGTPLYAYDLVRIREQAASLLQAFERASAPAAAGAQGAAGARGARLRPRPRTCRDRRVFTGRGPARPRARVGARGDLVHRDEPVRARRRRAGRDPRPREPRPARAARPVGAARAGLDGGDPREPARRRLVERVRRRRGRVAVRGDQGHEVRDPAGAARRRARARREARRRDRHGARPRRRRVPHRRPPAVRGGDRARRGDDPARDGRRPRRVRGQRGRRARRPAAPRRRAARRPRVRGAARLGPLGLVIGCGPGDYLCKESGVLLAEVVTLDERDGVAFAGLDAGFNVAPERFIYAALVPIVLCRAADVEPARTYTIAGNINEGDDLWGEEIPLPELHEGDVLALFLVGTYNRSMHLDHCLRPPAGTIAFADRGL